MNEEPEVPSAWTVRSVVVLPERKGVEVTLAVDGRDPVRFRTKRFGVGRRGPRSAALAKFADQAGYGDAEELYRWICFLPEDYRGALYWGKMPWEESEAPALKCFCPAEEAA